MPQKGPRKTGAKKGAGAAARKATASPMAREDARWGPRADKGDGEAAIQARIKALAEPSRSILARLHPLVMKHGDGLLPTVRYGFAIYMREGKMVLVAAPRKAYVSFGYTNDAGINEEPLKFTSPDEIDERKVASIVQRVST